MNTTRTTAEEQDNDDERAMKLEQVRAALIACQPQEGSLPNTLTKDGIQELLPVVESLRTTTTATITTTSSSSSSSSSNQNNNKNNNDDKKKLDILAPWPTTTTTTTTNDNDRTKKQKNSKENPSTNERKNNSSDHDVGLDWYGAPRFQQLKVNEAETFRLLVRSGQYTKPTNAQCPGYLQCNLVVLPAGKIAFDFLLFCQRNPKACPLLDVCENGSTNPIALATNADLRTDCPKYAIYRNGRLEKEVHDVIDYWPEDAVSFLIGCSFSYDGALLDADIPLRSAELGRNVPMYKTNVKCRPAGTLQGNMVVSMKPIPAMKVAKHIEITNKYTHAHGGPVCVGAPTCLGITNLNKPQWGDSIDIQPDEIPIFHACGVTPQDVLMESRVPFAITHAAGHMFVTDRPAHMNVI